jgi:hypothetical protein
MREEQESLEHLTLVEASLNESSGQGVTDNFRLVINDTDGHRQPAMLDLNKVLLAKLEKCSI